MTGTVSIRREAAISVGIATAPKLGLELERLLACADAALYRAKNGGMAGVEFARPFPAAPADAAGD